ncbi:phosphatase 2C-like domain-containing protein [Boletus reticuloceps]|uniref:Phosphatase 2C-like domain-containing protein n=1 Tax=Boletus reticuloceps TaxID=495285 RepID=A0A8I3AAY0_9AGAM|nr:phosphatase 2C-like domain-containing protein [Boletus reticuloceps]
MRLNATAKSETIVRPGGITWKYSTASVAANDPLEDAHAEAIVAREPSDPKGPGDWLFFAVMDGHGGPHTSRLLSNTLINAIVLQLSSLIHGSSGPMFSKPGVQNPQTISSAIQSAFTKLDAELINAPLKVLASNMDKESLLKKIIPDLSEHPLALPMMLPAVSGSCALMAVFDTAQRDLYVACSGDSRAVAGFWEESADGTGSWRVEVLSEDQTGRNPNELKRMQSEHPKDEAENVIRAGRVLGGLEPTRAFGDARYKWPARSSGCVSAIHFFCNTIREMTLKSLSQAFMVGNNQPLRPAPASLKTPPYVTATPVVTHRKFSLDDGPSDASKRLGSRFVVLATDGLWDKLSSEEVVALVGGHLKGLRGTVSKAQLQTLVPTSSGSPTVEGKDKVRRNTEGSWFFQDDELSVHLIRNAFGGGDTSALRKLMSIPSPFARRYRDDTTVSVIWWDEQDNSPKVVEFKAKL